MRVFIAIPLSDKMKRALGQVIHEMKKSGARGRYTVPENMHLTLAFIGETDMVKDIQEALDQVSFQPFKIVTDGFGHFGNLYWVGLKEEPGLNSLVRSVRTSLSDCGISYDKKSFKAHITIARRVEARQAIRVRVPNVEMEVDSFCLMRSDRIKGQMKYRELADWDARELFFDEESGRELCPEALGAQESLHPVCLVTQRMVIRQISKKDKEDYLYGLSLASQHRSAYEDPEIADLLWKDVVHDQDSITMIMYDKASGAVVGTCSFDNWTSDYPEIGINVDPAHHNQGLGTETVRRMTEVFKELRPEGSLYIRTRKSNISCQKMIEKCGGRRIDLGEKDEREELLSYTLQEGLEDR